MLDLSKHFVEPSSEILATQHQAFVDLCHLYPEISKTLHNTLKSITWDKIQDRDYSDLKRRFSAVLDMLNSDKNYSSRERERLIARILQQDEDITAPPKPAAPTGLFAQAFAAVGSAAGSVTSYLRPQATRRTTHSPPGRSDSDFLLFLDRVVRDDSAFSDSARTIKSFARDWISTEVAATVDVLVGQMKVVVEAEHRRGVEVLALAGAFNRCRTDLQRALDPTGAR